MAFSGTTAGSKYVPAAGITETSADGRYVQLAPAAVQTGADVYLQLGSSKSFELIDSAGDVLIDMNDVGSESYIRAAAGQTLVLGAATGAVETERNTLDDGSGNMILTGYLKGPSAFSIYAGAQEGLIIDTATGVTTVQSPGAATYLTFTNSTTTIAVGGEMDISVASLKTKTVTGAQTVTFAASNGPSGITNLAHPSTWMVVIDSSGTQGYIPVWE